MAAVQETIDQVKSIDVTEYKYGFVTEIEMEKPAKGLTEDTCATSRPARTSRNGCWNGASTPIRRWLTMTEPTWARVHYPKIDYQDIYYYAAPKKGAGAAIARRGRSGDPRDLQEARHPAARAGDPGRRRAGEPRRGRCRVRLGLGRHHLQGGAEAQAGVIFCSISEAIREHPELVKKYLGTVVPVTDNYFATLNSRGVLRRLVRLHAAGRALPDGAVDLFPHQRAEHRPVRAHADHRRQGLLCQLSRRLHRAEARREPAACGGGRADRARRCRDQVLDRAELVSGRRRGQGRHLQFRHQARRLPRQEFQDLSWTQVETGSAITWKYPSCILRGDGSRGEFYSIAISNGFQQVDSGTKMIHLGKNTTSRIISKGIAAGKSQNTYRGLVSAHRKATGARNFTNCDSLLIGDKCGAHTVPYIEAKTASRSSSTRRRRRRFPRTRCSTASSAGSRRRRRSALIVNGFVKDVLQQLPMEFAVEAQKLISISLEGSVG
jgi:Fe-S cluster assembly protein SufB